MAQNLRWLNETEFKDEKIIVWAANFHVAKSLKVIKDLPNSSRGGQHKGRAKFTYDAKETMGDHFVNKFNNKNNVYVLGFDSYSGTFGRANGLSPRVTVTPPKEESFENWIDKKHQFAFVDFSAFNKTNPKSTEYFNMSGLGHVNLEGKWNEVFDGIFFIRDIYPCETTP
jgi:erythromycin esterase-like protein